MLETITQAPGVALIAGWRPPADVGEVWHPAQVVALRDLTPTVREFTLQAPTLAMQAASATPGAHVRLRFAHRGRSVERRYSLIPADRAAGDDPGVLRIAVKRLDAGRGGSLALHQLPLGAAIEVQAPANHFALDLTAPGYVLLAGGIGVTPLVSMAEALARLRRRAPERPLTMHYAARSADEWAYRERLTAALGANHLFCHADALGQRLDLQAAIATLPPGGQCYACGPASMLDALRALWSAAGRAAADLRFETFGASGRLPNRAFRVHLPRLGRSLDVAAGDSLLDALEAASVPMLAECRRGECGLCALDVLACDGELDHRDVFLSAEQKAAGRTICACVSRAHGTLTLDTAWRGRADDAAAKDAANALTA